jgi:basic membrane protein A
MKSVFLWLVLLQICVGLFLGCQSKDEQRRSTKQPATPSGEAPRLKVAVVYDVGGRGDKGFNDLAYRGVEEAKKDLGIEYVVAEPTEGSDRETHLRRFAAGDAGLIFGIGMLFTDDITRIARAFPQKKFACVDYIVPEAGELPPNLLALKFREEEGSFLVGAVAGLLTRTNKVGFVGGMETPLIRKFEKGFTAGVKALNPSCEVAATYAGVTDRAFADPTKGKELAISLYNGGADIIYQAAGATGLGVFKAAEEMGKRAIGVDSDQADEAKPRVIITSMLKGVDRAVFETIKDTLEGRFHGGVKELGLKEDGVGYVYDDKNRDIIGEENHQKIEQLKARIIHGEIIVPKD